MEKKPSFVIESEKVKELIKRLKPITDWSKVKKSALIFHKTTNSIHKPDKFLLYNEKQNQVEYENSDKELHYMSAANWYYFDEFIEDQVEEEFRPKLWWSHKYNYPEDFWICVARDVNELRQRYEEERKETITQEEFEENYDYSIIDNIDDYRIDLK